MSDEQWTLRGCNDLDHEHRRLTCYGIRDAKGVAVPDERVVERIASLTRDNAALRKCMTDIRHTLGNTDPNSSLSVLDRLQGNLELEAATQQVIEVCDMIDHALAQRQEGKADG